MNYEESIMNIITKPIFIFLIILSLLSGSCSPKYNLTPDLTPTPKVIATSVPTNTSTPTETPNPLANAPEGTTKLGENGKWIKEVYFPDTNKTVEFEYKKIVGQNGKTMFEDWTKDIILGEGAPIVDFGHNNLGYSRLGNVKLLCSASLEICGNLPVFRHIDLTTEDNKESNLSSYTYPMLYNRTHNGVYPVGHQMYDYLLEKNGVVDLDFFIDNSEDIKHWKMSSSTGAVGIFINWDDLAGAKEFGFGGGILVRTKLLGLNNKGELIGFLASNKPVPPSDIIAWTRIVFLQSSMVIQQPNIMDVKELSILDHMAWDVFNHPSLQGDYWIVQVPDN